MDVVLLETREQCALLEHRAVNGALRIALTTQAMYGCAERAWDYTTPADFLSLDYFIYVRQESRERNILFCRAMDELIRQKAGITDETFEPFSWHNKYTFFLIQSVLSYARCLKAVIEQQRPAKISFFAPVATIAPPGNFDELYFSPDSFLSQLCQNLSQEYPQIKWEAIPIENNYGLTQARREVPFRKRMLRLLPWGLLRAGHALRKRDWKYFQPTLADKPHVLRLGTNADIRTVVQAFCEQEQSKIFRKEDFAQEIGEYVPAELLGKFMRRNRKLLPGLSENTVLFQPQDLLATLQRIYEEVPQSLLELMVTKSHSYQNSILATTCLYQVALNKLKAYHISLVVAHSGVDPYPNAIMAAARRIGIKTVVCQHGGDFGESFDYGENQETCYAFADYFGLWGRKTQPLLEKYIPTRCKFFYLGHLQRKTPSPLPVQAEAREGRAIKKVLFVPNNAFHAYMPVMKDCLFFRLNQKMIEIFKRHQNFQYQYRPSPKEVMAFNPLNAYVEKHLPGVEIIDKGSLSAACAQADLVIIDCLSTTLHDALSVNSRIIGLKHPTYIQYFPEVEVLVKKACVFCKTEEEFLKNIELYLSHPERFPDFEEGIKAWKDFCFDASTEKQFSERFAAHLNLSRKESLCHA